MGIKVKYWLEEYQKLRLRGDFHLADQLREMMRRMGYEIRVSKDKVTAIKHD